MTGNCKVCGRGLVHDEVALTKKIYNRTAKEFMCLSCLAKIFDVSEDTLKGKIAEFKNMGCTLFEEKEETN